MSIKHRRFTAYLIDLLIVSLFVSLLSQINFLNPYKKEYNNAYNNYLEYYSESQNMTYENAEDLFTKEYISIMKDLEYYSYPVLLINAVVIILYFTLFPYFNNNQTIGKRIMKIKIVSANKQKEVTLFQHFMRSLILPKLTSITLSSALGYLLSSICVLTFKGKAYIYIALSIGNIFNILGYADIIKLLINKNGKSLHDVISRTEVIECA